MQLLTYGLMVFAFLVGAIIVLFMTSPNNKLRFAAWAETSARAQIETQIAKEGIAIQARNFQRTREAELLREHVDQEPRQEQVQEARVELGIEQEFTRQLSGRR